MLHSISGSVKSTQEEIEAVYLWNVFYASIVKKRRENLFDRILMYFYYHKHADQLPGNFVHKHSGDTLMSTQLYIYIY
jgi:hypothetical protein